MFNKEGSPPAYARGRRGDLFGRPEYWPTLGEALGDALPAPDEESRDATWCPAPPRPVRPIIPPSRCRRS